jgi:hypothetical protein
MKKLFVLLTLLAISPLFSCDDDSDKNQVNPAMLLLLGNNTLTVNVTYYAGPYTLGSPAGTGKVFAYLYTSNPTTGLAPTRTKSPVKSYYASTASAVTSSAVQTITLNGIVVGNYYLMVFYDYKSCNTPPCDDDNQSDYYTLYNNTTSGTSCSAAWLPINIPSTTSIDITLDGSDQLLSGGSDGLGASFKTTECP